MSTGTKEDQLNRLPLLGLPGHHGCFVRRMVQRGHLSYKQRLIKAVQATAHRVAKVVTRPEFTKGFILLSKRWRVEQSIGALAIARRLKVDS